MSCQIPTYKQDKFDSKGLSVMKFKLYMHHLYGIVVIYLFISVYLSVSSVKKNYRAI